MSGRRGASTSRFKIVPDPPIAGRKATVTYLGPANEVEYHVDGQPPVRVRPDRDGKFVIDPVPSGNEIAFTDGLGLPGFLHRDILQTDK